jgi:hypothetical protein
VQAPMYCVLRLGRGCSAEKAAKTLCRMIKDRASADAQHQPDHERLIHDIYAANVRISIHTGLESTAKELRIGQLLARHSQYSDELEAKGLKVIKPNGGGEAMLFIDCDSLRQGLLRGTHWQDKRTDQVLLRATGAKRDQERCQGGRSRGISIPLSQCLDGTAPV